MGDTGGERAHRRHAVRFAQVDFEPFPLAEIADDQGERRSVIPCDAQGRQLDRDLGAPDETAAHHGKGRPLGRGKCALHVLQRDREIVGVDERGPLTKQ